MNKVLIILFVFSENLGAVRELSKVTGHLGDRVEDLEKANECVAVRLSKLKRGGSVKSTSSSLSTNSDSNDFKSRKSKNPKAKTLFQNKCVQMIMLCLVAIIAISMVAMATIYIMDYFKKEESNNNSTRLIVIEEELKTTSESTTTSISTIKPSAQISQLHIIGLIHGCTEPLEDKCQTYCCVLDTNEVSNEVQETPNFINEVPVFIVEPEILKTTEMFKTTSTMRSTSTSPRSTSTPVSSTSLSSTSDVKKLMDLLSAEDPEIHKHNQVLDDVNKATLDTKDKVDNVKVVTKDLLLATEKPAGVKMKPTIRTLKKDDVNEVDIEGEQFNEVIDHIEDDENDVKSLNESSIGNITKEDFETVPQRARRDITFKNLGEKFGNFVTGLVRRIRDTGHTLRADHQPRRAPFISGMSY